MPSTFAHMNHKITKDERILLPVLLAKQDGMDSHPKILHDEVLSVKWLRQEHYIYLSFVLQKYHLLINLDFEKILIGYCHLKTHSLGFYLYHKFHHHHFIWKLLFVILHSSSDSSENCESSSSVSFLASMSKKKWNVCILNRV